MAQDTPFFCRRRHHHGSFPITEASFERACRQLQAQRTQRRARLSSAPRLLPPAALQAKGLPAGTTSRPALEYWV
eukprot:364243-Chlamydomonas_euryale.AAC.4